MNTELADYMYTLQNDKPQLIDFSAARAHAFGPPDAPFPVNDTIGYGVLLGLLWKVTHTLSFNDVVWLQIFLYCVMVFLIYQIGVMLFATQCMGRGVTIAFLCYLPLIALNVHAVRDVWAAYAIIVLLYGVLAYLKHKTSWIALLSGCMFFAVCQWIRPSVFLAVITGIIALSVYALCVPTVRKRCMHVILTLLVVNMCLFWIPFMYYNQSMYRRVLVSPAGQDLLEGLGEFDNPWGHQLSDEYVARYVESRYAYRYGTPEFDDAAKQVFLQCYQERPDMFWKNIVRRIPMMILPSLPWLFYPVSLYKDHHASMDKLLYMLQHPSLWIDCVLRHVYMRLYIVFGWIGLMLMIWRRKYTLALIVIAVLVASVAKLPSHIEYRYLTPYYWIFCLSIAYVYASIKKRAA